MAGSVSNDVPIQAPGALRRYPEMILTAIEELGKAGGSNKSAISKQMKSTYSELPPAHSTLLTHHLNIMKNSGQLNLSKNNYLVPDPNSPPPRGRGRPRKLKSAAAGPAGSPRPRGRPPKTVDLDAPPAAARILRPRGRLLKAVDLIAPPAPKASSSRNGRGRPSKPKSGGDVAAAAPVVGVKRGRGRPPKSAEPKGLPRDIRVLVLPVLAPATLPSYPEMILTAIEGLNNLVPSSASRGGSRGRKPKPGNANGPPGGSARPCGQPIKVKAHPAAPVGNPRSRGHPAKAVAIKPASSGKGRGRPPKKAKNGDGDVASAGPVVGVKRSRGRPPKVKA